MNSKNDEKIIVLFNLLFDKIKIYLMNKITFISFLSLDCFLFWLVLLINAKFVLFLLKVCIKIPFILNHEKPYNRSHCGL